MRRPHVVVIDLANRGTAERRRHVASQLWYNLGVVGDVFLWYNLRPMIMRWDYGTNQLHLECRHGLENNNTFIRKRLH